MFRFTWLALALFLGLAVSAAAAEPTGVDLASLSGWDIVVAPDASPAEVYAAEEFRAHVAQATGNATGAELSDLRNYVMARLLWNPNQSGRQLADEFLDLHYGKAAPPIRRFINFYHDRCEAKGVHRNCFGNARDYAIDEEVCKAAMDAFAEALALAESDAARARVEKASICAYRCAIQPAWSTRGETPLAADAAAKLRPVVRRFCQLCDKYQLPMFAEVIPMDDAKKRLRTNLGMKADEAF